ncbi:MAG: hypothetical protein ACREO7_00845 [Pseudoxanthomonas sp.]
MIPNTRPLRFVRLVVVTAALLALAACATAPTGGALVVGQQATIEGDVASVDTNPWTYDGNAVVTISTIDVGTVSVQLPARWNLCKAPPLGDVQALKPGDRVQVVGTVTAPGEMVVCSEPEHRLRKVE